MKGEERQGKAKRGKERRGKAREGRGEGTWAGNFWESRNLEGRKGCFEEASWNNGFLLGFLDG